MSESLYNAVKSGRVKLQDLNDEGKNALRSFMEQKQRADEFQSQQQSLVDNYPRMVQEDNNKQAVQGLTKTFDMLQSGKLSDSVTKALQPPAPALVAYDPNKSVSADDLLSMDNDTAAAQRLQSGRFGRLSAAQQKQLVNQARSDKANADRETNVSLRHGFGAGRMNPYATDAVEGLSNIAMNATNNAALGIPDALMGHELANRPEYEQFGSGAGKLIGDLAPVAKTYSLTKGLATGAGKLLGRSGMTDAIEQIGINNGIGGLSKLANAATRGAIAGGAYAGAKEALDAGLDVYGDGNQTLGQRAARFGETTALFGGGDAAIGVLGTGAKTFATSKLGQAFGNFLSRNRTQEAPAQQDVFALPPASRYESVRSRAEGTVLPSNKTPIYGQGEVRTFALPEPNILPPTRGRLEARVNPYEQKLNELFNVANREKLPPGREREAIEDLWSRMAGPQDPSLDELIDLAYPKQTSRLSADLASKAREQQRMREVAGAPNVVRSMEDRYQPFVGEAAGPTTKVGIRQPDVEMTVPQRNFATQPKLNTQVGRRTETPIDAVAPIKEPRIRDKVYNYLDEAEKAARERLKAKRNTLSSNPLDQYADHAIIGAAKLGKGAIKFADWSEEMVKEFGEEIRPALQGIYKRSVTALQDTERRASKDAHEARTFNARATGDANSFRGKVSRGKQGLKTPFAKRWEKIRSQFVDDEAALEGLEKRIRGKLSSAEDSLYKSARLFRGVPEKANLIVKNRLAPIVNGIEKTGYSSDDLGDYALAVHAQDVNARDIKSGFTDKEIDQVMQRFGTPEMEAARKELVRIGDDMLDELAKAGVISRDLVQSLRDRYPNYVPLFRAFDDNAVEFSSGLSKALANVSAPIKGLVGSERQVIDPLENMVKNIFQSTNAAERNKVALQLAKLSKGDVNATFIRRLKDGEEVGRKNVVSVLQDGNKVRYEVEPEVYKAMLNLDQESSNMLIKVLQQPASVLRAGATLTPEFSLRNPLRDVPQAFVTSESGFNPLIDFPVGIIQAISKGDLYKQWVNELGGFGNVISNDRNIHQEALKRVLRELPGKKFVNVLNGKSLFRVLRAIADTSESATKIGEFRAALRQGQTPQEAAYRSRDVMDFGRSGTSVKQTNKIVAFLNANIQGKSKLVRAFKSNPGGFTARAFALVTVPTIGVFLAQKYWANDEQKRTIDEAPAWMKDSFWLMPVPGTNHVARLPKPFDLSILFSNLPERALNFVFNNDKKSFDGFARKAMADTALPGMISALTPLMEGMANYSFFRGGRIIPMGEDGRNYADQYDINTTETAKLLAKGAQYLTGANGSLKNFSSPRIMDNTISGLTAGLGGYATSAIDVLLDKFHITNNPARPAKGAAQQPLAKAFLVNPLQSGKSVERLYDLQDELTRQKGSAKLHNQPFKDAGKLGFINDQTQLMSNITKQIKAIETSRNLTPTQKRDSIEPLLRKRNAIAVSALKRVNP